MFWLYIENFLKDDHCKTWKIVRTSCKMPVALNSYEES